MYETAVQPRLADLDFSGLWKPDWDVAREAYSEWWKGRGLALHITAPRDIPATDIEPPMQPDDLESRWLDPHYRVQGELARASRRYYGGIAYPNLHLDIGPGSLGLFLGAEGHLAETTVWYGSCLDDYDDHPEIVFDESNAWFQRHLALIKEAIRRSDGHVLTGCPDLIENIDTLAALRGNDRLLFDLIELPDAAKVRLGEINRAFFAAFDLLWGYLEDPWGGNGFNAFGLWGPGKTAKVQCDFSCMISPDMFNEFVIPFLEEQCAWLDYSMYHLDGTQAMQHLPSLLDCEHLDAIEWTPQAGIPGGGSPDWYPMYREIRAAGKSVQAIGVAYDEVEPLIDAVGAEGLYISTHARTETDARALLSRLSWPGDC